MVTIPAFFYIIKQIMVTLYDFMNPSLLKEILNPPLRPIYSLSVKHLNLPIILIFGLRFKKNNKVGWVAFLLAYHDILD